MTLQKLVENYCNTRKKDKAMRKTHLKHFIKYFKNRPITSLKHSDCEKFIAKNKKYSPATLRGMTASLKGFSRFLFSEGIIKIQIFPPRKSSKYKGRKPMKLSKLQINFMVSDNLFNAKQKAALLGISYATFNKKMKEIKGKGYYKIEPKPQKPLTRTIVVKRDQSNNYSIFRR